jgi:hypothetical protein
MAMTESLAPSLEREPCRKMKARRLMVVQYFIKQPGERENCNNIEV